MGRGFARPIPVKQHLAEQALGLGGANKSYKELYNLMSRMSYVWDKEKKQWRGQCNISEFTI